jgi:hypothetical protein
MNLNEIFTDYLYDPVENAGQSFWSDGANYYILTSDTDFNYRINRLVDTGAYGKYGPRGAVKFAADLYYQFQTEKHACLHQITLVEKQPTPISLVFSDWNDKLKSLRVYQNSADPAQTDHELFEQKQNKLYKPAEKPLTWRDVQVDKKTGMVIWETPEPKNPLLTEPIFIEIS